MRAFQLVWPRASPGWLRGVLCRSSRDEKPHATHTLVSGCAVLFHVCHLRLRQLCVLRDLGWDDDGAADVTNVVSINHVRVVYDAEDDTFIITINGHKHRLSPASAEYLFLALGREFHPSDMARWFPSADRDG